MKTKTSKRKCGEALLSLLIYLVGGLSAHAQVPNGLVTTTTLTFDNLSAGSDYSVIPDGYGGLNWNNFGVINGENYVAGYFNGVVSSPNVAFDPFGFPGSISSATPFNLVSAYMTASAQDGLQLEVQGFVGTTLTYDNTYTLNESGPLLLQFNYVGVDEVNFNRVSSYQQQFVLDNLTVSESPEPNVLTLFGLGIVLAGWAMQRRLAAKDRG